MKKPLILLALFAIATMAFIAPGKINFTSEKHSNMNTASETTGYQVGDYAMDFKLKACRKEVYS